MKKTENLNKIFDRKTFSPSEFQNDDFKILQRLRNPGFRRACSWRLAEEENFSCPYPNVYSYRGLESTAMSFLRMYLGYKKLGNNTTFLDVGCGHSADCRVALREGAKVAYRLDLFDVSYLNRKGEVFIKADCAEKIPLKDNSVDYIVSQAMANLIEPFGRKKFYKEVKRVMKKDGLFVIYTCKLRNAWGWDMGTEKENIRKAGLRVVDNFSGGLVVMRQEKV